MGDIATTEIVVKGNRDWWLLHSSSRRAEDYVIVISLARKCACAVIIGIAICPRTSSLENRWIICGFTCCWVGELSTTAILVLSESLTCAFTCNDSFLFISAYHLQLFRASCLQTCSNKTISSISSVFLASQSFYHYMKSWIINLIRNYAIIVYVMFLLVIEIPN